MTARTRSATRGFSRWASVCSRACGANKIKRFGCTTAARTHTRARGAHIEISRKTRRKGARCAHSPHTSPAGRRARARRVVHSGSISTLGGVREIVKITVKSHMC
eukprot:5174699-Prymnesium_polylepis.1